MWDWEEGLGEAISTFYQAAEFCKEYDYIFCHNEAILYEYIENTDPALFAEIKNQVESNKPTENTEPVQTQTQSAVSKTYTYTINGKPKTVKRNYEIKETTSFRTKAVREQVKKYVEEHKQQLSEIPSKHRASTLIKNLQTDMNIHVSYNSAIKLLTEAELK
jgi:hypothetical protein